MADRQEIIGATDEAIEAFWAVIAKNFPEIKGNLSPSMVNHIAVICQSWVTEWLENNKNK